MSQQKRLRPQQKAILDCMREWGTTTDIIHEKTGIPKPSIRRSLRELQSYGLVKKGTEHRMWRIVVATN